MGKGREGGGEEWRELWGMQSMAPKPVSANSGPEPTRRNTARENCKKKRGRRKKERKKKKGTGRGRAGVGLVPFRLEFRPMDRQGQASKVSTHTHTHTHANAHAYTPTPASPSRSRCAYARDMFSRVLANLTWPLIKLIFISCSRSLHLFPPLEVEVVAQSRR